MMVTWRKSSHSANGGDCVEVGWRTSSYSANGGELRRGRLAHQQL